MKTIIQRSAPYMMILFLAMVLSGCLNRRILDVKDHPTKPGTVIETRDAYTIAEFIPYKVVKRFWQCSEKGETLKCEQICGDDKEVACPRGLTANDRRFQ